MCRQLLPNILITESTCQLSSHCKKTGWRHGLTVSIPTQPCLYNKQLHLTFGTICLITPDVIRELIETILHTFNQRHHLFIRQGWDSEGLRGQAKATIHLLSSGGSVKLPLNKKKISRKIRTRVCGLHEFENEFATF